jgi:hypothetical protein
MDSNSLQERSTGLESMDPETLLSDLAAMRMRETKYLMCADYVHRSSACLTPSVSEHEVLDRRTQIIQWLVKMCEQCQYQQCIVWMTMNVLERFLAVEQEESEKRTLCAGSFWRRYMLAATASFYIVSKIHEYSAIPIEVMATLTRGAFTAEDIEEMEQVILRRLTWLVNPVTPHAVSEYLIALIPSDDPEERENLLHLTTLQLDAMVYDYELCRSCTASKIAVGALLNTIEILSRGIQPETLNDYTNCLSFAIQSDCSFERGIFKQVQERLHEVLYFQESFSSATSGPGSKKNASEDDHCSTRKNNFDLFLPRADSPRSVYSQAASMEF